MSRTLAANCGSLDRLNCRTRCGCNPGLRQMRCTELTLMPLAWAMATAVQCVVSPGGSVNVSATSHTDKAARSLRPTSLLRNGIGYYAIDELPRASDPSLQCRLSADVDDLTASAAIAGRCTA